MNRKIVFIFIVILLLALICLISYKLLCKVPKKKETFVNTQTCLKLSSDEISTATKICNNFINIDESTCKNMIMAAACPIENSIAKNATPVDGSNVKKSQSDVNMEYDNSTDIHKKSNENIYSA